MIRCSTGRVHRKSCPQITQIDADIELNTKPQRSGIYVWGLQGVVRRKDGTSRRTLPHPR